MKALTFQGIGEIACDLVPDPVLKCETDVIVKVERAAICGSDMHPYTGRERGIDVGTIMGHEFAGVVVETGTDTLLQVGDRVVSPFTTNCGHCYFCKIGLTARCQRGELFGWVENGVGLQGAQAEFVRVPLADSTLVRFAEALGPEKALLAGDILSTGMYCADRAEVRPDGVYAVVGCGPVGLMTIMACVSMGVHNIFAFDSIPERLDRATRLGVTAVNFQSEDPRALIASATEGRGVDAVMEAVGSPSAGKLAFDLVRPGGIISTVGVHTDAHLDFSPADAYNKNITYRVGRCPARHYMERALDLLGSSSTNFDSIITHRISLAQGAASYAMCHNKSDGCLKVLIEPGT